MSDAHVVLGGTAWLKLMLHVCKHAAAPAGGFLLGRRTEGADGAGGVEVQDAVPLFHHLPTPAMAAACADMVRAWCESRGQAIVGMYHCNVVAADRAIPKNVDRIAAALGSGMSVLVVRPRLPSSFLSPAVVSSDAVAVGFGRPLLHPFFTFAPSGQRRGHRVRPPHVFSAAPPPP